MQQLEQHLCHGGMTENDKNGLKAKVQKRNVFCHSPKSEWFVFVCSVLFCLFDFVCSIFIQVGSGTTEDQPRGGQQAADAVYRKYIKAFGKKSGGHWTRKLLFFGWTRMEDSFWHKKTRQLREKN